MENPRDAQVLDSLLQYGADTDQSPKQANSSRSKFTATALQAEKTKTQSEAAWPDLSPRKLRILSRS